MYIQKFFLFHSLEELILYSGPNPLPYVYQVERLVKEVIVKVD